MDSLFVEYPNIADKTSTLVSGYGGGKKALEKKLLKDIIAY